MDEESKNAYGYHSLEGFGASGTWWAQDIGGGDGESIPDSWRRIKLRKN